MFETAIDVYVYMYITNLNTHTCDQNKFMSNIFLSYLQLLIMNISFVSLTCVSHCYDSTK
jgi:hypothetical protein